MPIQPAGSRLSNESRARGSRRYATDECCTLPTGQASACDQEVVSDTPSQSVAGKRCRRHEVRRLVVQVQPAPEAGAAIFSSVMMQGLGGPSAPVSGNVLNLKEDALGSSLVRALPVPSSPRSRRAHGVIASQCLTRLDQLRAHASMSFAELVFANNGFRHSLPISVAPLAHCSPNSSGFIDQGRRTHPCGCRRLIKVRFARGLPVWLLSDNSARFPLSDQSFSAERIVIYVGSIL